MRGDLPRAKSAQFEVAKDGHVEFLAIKNDKQLNGIGYASNAVGDSGSAYMVKSEVNGEARYTFVGLVSVGGVEENSFDKAIGVYDEGKTCNEWATTFNKKSLEWLKEKAGIPY